MPPTAIAILRTGTAPPTTLATAVLACFIKADDFVAIFNPFCNILSIIAATLTPFLPDFFSIFENIPNTLSIAFVNNSNILPGPLLTAVLADLAAATKTPTSAEFTAVTEIETDAYGNVVNGSIKTKKLTVRDTHANISQVVTGVEVADTKDKATITTGVTDTDTVSKTDTFALSSTSLEITSVGSGSKEAAINLVWGTF